VLNDEVEPLILQHRPSLSNGTFTPPSDWVRPFVESSTSKSLAISDSTTTVVEFMEEDESMGEVSLNWLGPSPTEYRTNLAVQILGDYLTHSATAPLQKAFVEIPKPYCTGISFHTEDRVNHNELSVTAWDVPTKHLEALGKMLVDKMRAIAQDEGIDMERLGLVLRRSKRKLLEYMETNVSGVLSDVVIAGRSTGSRAELRLQTFCTATRAARTSLRRLTTSKIMRRWSSGPRKTGRIYFPSGLNHWAVALTRSGTMSLRRSSVSSASLPQRCLQSWTRRRRTGWRSVVKSWARRS
jgi:hypothetical protein